jgi:FtsH-binding integral membrane protein
MNQPMNPFEAARSLVEGLSWSDASYTLIAIAGVFMFYAIAARRPSGERPSWLAVMFWLISLVGWGFEMYMVTAEKIKAGGALAWGLLFIAAVVLTFAIPALTRRTRLYERIMSGSAIALIGFGMIASFGRGYQPLGYGLGMGLVLGLILGMFVSVRRNLDRDLTTMYENADKEPAKRERKVTEI